MTSTAISSILGVFGLTQAILSFDWVAMLTYFFTVVFGLVFGWITMNEVEYYWTNTYYKLYVVFHNPSYNFRFNLCFGII